ncbi:uncharacterized protein N7500_007639 [Penicillium coprophilum]|uniref:uncharacterized protein n=1 Tax=Penicillium coprophilum TaxID=36646 RepID=UPI0023A00B86|nr:uncharacterized protein N7500_007639 [Penicillium coprophilum]KAJ5157988.1 hypothetical protein N7500_007639 [Penicillium coprophilum]
MVYKSSKKPYARQGKSQYRPRRGGASSKYNRGTLDKYIEAKVQRAVKKASRGPPRSVPVQLTPAQFDRNHSIPQVKILDKWTTYFLGPSSAFKYGILPITEVIPTQRPSVGEADDRFRSHNKVLVKGVFLRMVVNHTMGVRLLVFAFRNGMRRDISPSISTRPFVDGSTICDPPVKGRPPSEVVFDVMGKEQLMGMEGSGKHGFRNLGVHDGPFAVTGQLNGRYDWKATDLTAFTSRFSKDEGRPVGTIHVKIDGGASKSHGQTYKALFGSGTLKRTNECDGADPSVTAWMGTRTRHVELFIKLNKHEKVTVSNGSLSINERPLELFVGFDSPSSMHAATSSAKDVASGAIMSMDMEVYYE